MSLFDSCHINALFFSSLFVFFYKDSHQQLYFSKRFWWKHIWHLYLHFVGIFYWRLHWHLLFACPLTFSWALMLTFLLTFSVTSVWHFYWHSDSCFYSNLCENATKVKKTTLFASKSLKQCHWHTVKENPCAKMQTTRTS